MDALRSLWMHACASIRLRKRVQAACACTKWSHWLQLGASNHFQRAVEMESSDEEEFVLENGLRSLWMHACASIRLRKRVQAACACTKWSHWLQLGASNHFQRAVEMESSDEEEFVLENGLRSLWMHACASIRLRKRVQAACACTKWSHWLQLGASNHFQRAVEMESSDEEEFVLENGLRSLWMHACASIRLRKRVQAACACTKWSHWLQLGASNHFQRAVEMESSDEEEFVLENVRCTPVQCASRPHLAEMMGETGSLRGEKMKTIKFLLYTPPLEQNMIERKSVRSGKFFGPSFVNYASRRVVGKNDIELPQTRKEN
uniref:Uncharacterized protein n=1 Tax=Timema douglasi TaxID=61478 RepID=A0A7R8VU75_TIMDO|nr:unnamed protein product [Timema douglasi]